MWLRGAIGSGSGALTAYARYFSRQCGGAQNLRKINPKVPPQEASSIAEGLYHIIKDNGPLTVSNTWNHAKEAGISGLNSKTHMKIMLKWMTGRRMLKLFCTHLGSTKKFLHSTLPEEPGTDHSTQLKLQSDKPSSLKKKKKTTTKKKKNKKK